MSVKGTRGYVLKVAVASASIGCASMLACGNSHVVGTVSSPPQQPVGTVGPAPQPTADASDAGLPTASDAVGTVAQAPDAPDAAAAPIATASASAAPRHRPTPYKSVPVIVPVVGTTAHAPDSKKP